MPRYYDQEQEAKIKRTIDDWMAASKAYHGDYLFIVGRLAGMFEAALNRLGKDEASGYLESMLDQTNFYHKQLVEEILEKKAA